MTDLTGSDDGDSLNLDLSNRVVDEADWAWVDEVADDESPDLSGQDVTAVLVAHDGAEWLPEALTGLAALRLHPDRVVLVDAGSTDATTDLFEAAAANRPGWQVVRTGADGFGAAVAAGLADLAADLDDDTLRPGDRAGGDVDDDTLPRERGTDALPATAESAASESEASEAGPRHDWVWLLHDDAVPEPDALQELLAAALTAGAAIAGPKLVQPRTRQEPARVSELGASVARSGRREVHVDPGEIDQGQHDQVAEVLGASTCGMLVRRDVFDQLGGFTPALPGHRDGVDLGWRAGLAGHTAIAVPTARIAHRQTGLAGLRPGSEDAAAADRAYGMQLVSAHARGVGRVVTPIRLVLGCLLRALGFMLGKAPDRAGDELAAVRRYLAGGRRTGEIRTRIAGAHGTAATRRRTRALRPGPFAGVRRLVDAAGANLADRRRPDEDVSDTGIDDLTGDDFSGHGADTRRPWQSAYLVAWLATGVLAIIAGRALLRPGALAGPGLLPAPADLSGIFGQWLAPVVGGDGILPGPPWLGLYGVVSTLTIGRPGVAASLLVLGMVPLTLLAARPLLGRLLADRRVRLWAGVTYAILPVLLGGSTQGRLVLAALALALPLLGSAVWSFVHPRDGGGNTAGRRRSALAIGLALTVVIAFQPLLAGFAVVAAVIGLLAWRDLGRRLGIGLALLVPAVLLAPWWPQLFAHPARFLLAPDPALDTGAAPAAWQLLLGRPAGEGLPPLWLGAVVVGVVWVVALAATFLRPTSGVVRAGWLVAIAGLLAAIVVTRFVVLAPPADTPVRPWAGGLLLLALGALVLVGAMGLDPVAAAMAGRNFSIAQPLVALGAVVLLVVTLLGVGWWVVDGGSDPTRRVTRDQGMPAFVTGELNRQPGSRALRIDQQGPVPQYVLVDGDGLRMGDAERGFTTGADVDSREQARTAVARLLAATGDETLAGDLNALGITHVQVVGPPELITRINGTPGLRVASVQPDGRIWRVTGEPQLTPPAAVPQQTGWIAAGQGAATVVVAFLAVPALRRSVSKDPVQSARRAARSRGEEAVR
ncbi:glycosyltransferase [Propionibacteriaceae bacterium Y2011]